MIGTVRSVEKLKTTNQLDILPLPQLCFGDSNESPHAPARTGSRADSFPRRISREDITMHRHGISTQGAEAGAFQSAAFAGVYGGDPAYTSKTPSTS